MLESGSLFNESLAENDLNMADLFLSNGDGSFEKRSMEPLWNSLNGNLTNIVSSNA